MKRIIILVCVCLTVFALTSLVSCKKQQPAETTITVTDMEGTTVTIPKNVSHVACISQSVTDFMIAFGLGDKIVGTYRSFTYNPWTVELYPASADFKAYSYSVSAEELLADGIDLVIIQDTENADAFRNAGIPVVAVHQYSPTGAFDEEVYDTARLIGEIFGGEAKQKATAWIQEVKDAIADIQRAVGTTNTEKTVYYVNGEKAKGLFYSDGGNSMISRILDVAGARLATEKYEVVNVHKVSDEEMIALNPDMMLIGGAYQNNLMDELNSSEVWSALDCNKNGRVYRIPVAMVGIENVSAETPVMLKYVASLIHPDYEFDMHEVMRDNVKRYFGYDLTDADIDNMCQGLTKSGERMINAN